MALDTVLPTCIDTQGVPSNSFVEQPPISKSTPEVRSQVGQKTEHEENKSPGDFIHVYNNVAERRIFNVNLIWQTPVLCLTGQAFLFSIALSATSSRFSRIIASFLCAVITFMTLQLIIQHRKTDEADRAWLKAFEEKYFLHYAKEMPVEAYTDERHHKAFIGSAHGAQERLRRHQTSPRMGWMDFLGSFRSSVIWARGMLVIEAVAIIVLLSAAIKPSLFV